MKLVTLVALTMLLATALCGQQLLTKGQDLKNYLEGAMDGTFIILFYDREAPQLRTEDMRNQIRTKIIRDHPSFNYFEVDVQEAEYNAIVDTMVGIDREEVKHSPTIMVASEGRGYWAHGDGAVDDIVYHLGDYSAEMLREARQRV